jgi:hypothetical protein
MAGKALVSGVRVLRNSLETRVTVGMPVVLGSAGYMNFNSAKAVSP